MSVRLGQVPVSLTINLVQTQQNNMNLPELFLERTRRLMGEEMCNALCEALEQDTPVSIRMNTAKYDRVPAHRSAVPWSEQGYYLGGRPTFTFDPLFHAGCYYVQEASSMFVEQALRRYVTEPSVMLDLCAAPGGKSTLCRSVLPEGSLLVANEVMRNRSQVLAENLVKWGHPEVVVTNNDPADFTPLEGVFDVVLTDVPCSGEGMFRKDPVAVLEWSPENVETCWQRQRRILRDIWPCLKPGGLLVYSTCTYNREENEDNVAWIAGTLGAEVLPLDVPEEWRVTGNLTGGDFPVYRFLPHKTQGEGLFLAVLRKHGETDGCGGTEGTSRKEKTRRGGREKGGKNGRPLAVPDEVKHWMAADGAFDYRVEGTCCVAIPKAWSDLYDRLKDRLRILHAGVTLGELKGKDWQPHHALAMSTALNRAAFAEAELTYEQAIAYLRKEAVTLDASAPKGYVLLTYRGVPLGFGKNIGNRVNNLYPNEWRIRSGYLPEEIILVD